MRKSHIDFGFGLFYYPDSVFSFADDKVRLNQVTFQIPVICYFMKYFIHRAVSQSKYYKYMIYFFIGIMWLSHHFHPFSAFSN